MKLNKTLYGGLKAYKENPKPANLKYRDSIIGGFERIIHTLLIGRIGYLQNF